jgi:CspA family cold shock protein
MSTDTATASQTDRFIGKVKWFNNKAGYGFITVSDEDESSSKDIFVHYSNINVASSQYKYLVQGEYVEFSISKTDGGAHEFQATEVTGIKGGSIMCETRRVSRESAPPRATNVARENSESNDGDVDEVKPRPPRRSSASNGKPDGRKPSTRKPVSRKPVETTDEEGFTTVKKKTVRKTEA